MTKSIHKMSNAERDSWTVQSARPYIPREEEPGQTFTEAQLPHPDVQRASGIDPELYRKLYGIHLVDAEEGMERPEFRGTETGVHPNDVTPGNLESFRSYPDGLPVEQDDEEEAPVEEEQK